MTNNERNKEIKRFYGADFPYVLKLQSLEKRVKELEEKLSGYAKADADMNEALNSGDGSYKP